MISLIEYIDNYKKELTLHEASHEEFKKLDFLRKIAIFLSNQHVDKKIEDIIQIMDENSGYSEYRIINDCESDNKDLWIEYDHGKIRLAAGDILIKMK